MKKVLALQVHSGQATLKTHRERLFVNVCPKGCVGVCFVFKSKTAAKKYWGSEVGLYEIELEETCQNK